MKILFIFPRDFHYDSKTVRELPSGGTEKTVVFLSEALQKLGHDCRLITHMEEVFDPEWPDVVITQTAQFFEGFPAGVKKIWWCHHFSDQERLKENTLWARLHADKVVTLSQCHQADFREVLKIDSTIIPHGVWLDEVVQGEKDPFRLIYASAPFRGLEKIPALFREIKLREPRATIAICSSLAMYGTPEEDAPYKNLFDELAGIEGVELLGALNQAQLYAEYARASVFFYPCTWKETYCLAMDEAMAHGCNPITSGLGALSERQITFEDGEDLSLVEAVIGGINLQLGTKAPKNWTEIALQWEALCLS